ncbi:MAG: hypothetical protein FJ088_12055 [Deltaproteobacteria bacterium]|nr:hypothetical protein [Deltaproteobacteria bacterium]
MEKNNCPESKRLLDLFLRDTKETADAGLFDHVRDCPDCRRILNALSIADNELSSLAGEKKIVTPFVEKFLDFDLVKRRAGLAGYFSSRGRDSIRGKDSAPTVKYAIAALVMTCLITLAIIFYRDKDDGFTPRGMEAHPLVEIFCVKTGHGGARKIDETRVGNILECEADDELLITYLNPSNEYRNLLMFAESEDGKIVWYHPNPVKKEPFAIETAERFTPLKNTIRLSTNHKAGRYKLYSYFCKEAIDFEELQVMLSRTEKTMPSNDISLTINECSSPIVQLKIF